MEYKTFDDTIVVRLDKGDEIAQCLLQIAQAEGITAAAISGIGAIDEMEVGVFDLQKTDYNRIVYTGNHEINTLVGNLSTKDARPYLHLHITCTGAGGKVVGGHLFRGRISLTAEIFVRKIAGTVDRRFNPALGINTIVFD